MSDQPTPPPARQPQQIGTPNPPPRDRRPGDNPVFDWFFAVVDGVADTVREMRDRGRAEANRAYDEGWERFDGKTRYRRKKPGADESNKE